jgi:hypothetical protein
MAVRHYGKSEVEHFKEKERVKARKRKPATTDEKLFIGTGLVSLIIFLLCLVVGILYNPDGAVSNIAAMIIIAIPTCLVLRKVL